MKVINHSQTPQIHLQKGKLQASFLESGDLYHFGSQDVLINQFLSNPIDGSMNQLYLRLFQEDGTIISQPLIGVESGSHFQAGKEQVKWTGSFKEIEYQVTFIIATEMIWFWKIDLKGQAAKVDIIYGQDLGVADIGVVQTNEAYAAQYVDHQAFHHDLRGYVVTSRQNMSQSQGNFPYVQLGALTEVASFVTDGYQFFGQSYKETNRPAALEQDSLACEVYQYEFDYTALQMKPFALKGEYEVVFYGVFQQDHPEVVKEIEFVAEVDAAWSNVEHESQFSNVAKLQKNPLFGEVLQTENLTKEEITTYYPQRLQEEANGSEWLSFFTDDYRHVVSKAKELQMERTHGHILFSGGYLKPDDSILTTTNWMTGVFNAQTLVGNTDMNKWFTNTRNSLNVFKTSGQRIYVKMAGVYQLLTMPSAYEMGINFSSWLYKTPDETFIVTVYSGYQKSALELKLEAVSGQAYEFVVTNQVAMNQKEYQTPFKVQVKDNQLLFTADEQALNYQKYPQLTYQLTVNGTEFAVRDEGFLVEGASPGSASLVVLELAATSQFSLEMLGMIDGVKSSNLASFEQESAEFTKYFRQLTNHFRLSKENALPNELEKLNILHWWYTHNMLVHYLVPHGLEQYGGAAWGTRDVSQGPVEYFLAMQHFDVVKEIIKILFSHQFEEDGNWPQWFMFDRYFEIHADESHGDIIVWPLKLVADYITISGDRSILDVQLPYMSHSNKEFTKTTATLLDHLKKEIEYIKDNFLWETHLSSYGDGDWDDTLQPHDQSLKSKMASSWTVALTYQALETLYQIVKDSQPEFAAELRLLTNNIRDDYNKYILSNSVIPGFVYMPSEDQVEFMIHPTDTKTGIDYRLLPMIEGITSEIFNLEQAEKHYQLIKKYLQHPDGVRLMNTPATYSGGISTNFKRAEQAANFGREVGLLYVHAHIRFVESMAKLGKTEELWHGLDVINPINIDKVVPNADKRQSNAYFSSSDGDFKTRYEAKEHFGKLRTGEVQVKGGWRIYSSGPGIYINQLITKGLGIAVMDQDLVLDPVLPKEYDGLSLRFSYHHQPVTFSFILGETEAIRVNGHELSGQPIANPYRKGGLRYAYESIKTHLKEQDNHIEVFYQSN